MWGCPQKQPGTSPSIPAVMYSPTRLPASWGRVPAPPISPGPATGAQVHGAAWPEGPTSEGWCASSRVLLLRYTSP